MAEIHLHHHNSKSSFWCYQGSIAEAAGYNEETVIVGRALQKDFEQRGVHLDSHRQRQASQMSEDIATLGMDISMQSCRFSHYAVFKIPYGFRYSLGDSVFPAVLFILFGTFLPDSPSSLIEQGHVNLTSCMLLLSDKTVSGSGQETLSQS